MVEANTAVTPMMTSTKLSMTDNDAFENAVLYRSMVGGLQYATITRPELAFSVNKVSRFMSNPKVSHYAAVKRIFKYVNGTQECGLTFRPSQSFLINALLTQFGHPV